VILNNVQYTVCPKILYTLHTFFYNTRLDISLIVRYGTPLLISLSNGITFNQSSVFPKLYLIIVYKQQARWIIKNYEKVVV